MAAITESITNIRNSVGRRFNWDYFLHDNLTGSTFLTVWVAILFVVTLLYTISQLNESFLGTLIILIAWLVGLGFTIASGLFQRRNRIGDWLHDNLLSSISNALLTLLIVLFLATLFRGAWSYAVANASFDPAKTTPDTRPENGAAWGVLIGAKDLLLYGRLDRQYVPRVNMTAFFVIGLAIVSYIANRIGLLERNKIVRQIIIGLWLLSPVIAYILLAGIPDEGPLIDFGTLITGLIVILALYGFLVWQRVAQFSIPTLIAVAVAWPVVYLIWRLLGQTGAFPPIDVDGWGGLLLTIIIALSVNVLSFPIGLALAMGRRSEIKGIPDWIVWPIAIIVAILGFTRSTPGLLANARNSVEWLLSFWPILILLFAYGLQRRFKGNVVAATSTLFIEIVRGVPLITLLFLGIIMAPFFLSEGASIANVYAVIIGYTLFSAAYMAELIRGGLQAIPSGQYEAADAIGLNALQKMRFIILPQALRILLPALVGSVIGAFKSSSLVSIVGLLDLVGIATSITGNPQWLGLKKELYYAMAIFYFLVSFAMSSYSRRLEKKYVVAHAR